MCFVVRKPVFRVFDEVRHCQTCNKAYSFECSKHRLKSANVTYRSSSVGNESTS